MTFDTMNAESKSKRIVPITFSAAETAVVALALDAALWKITDSLGEKGESIAMFNRKVTALRKKLAEAPGDLNRIELQAIATVLRSHLGRILDDHCYANTRNGRQERVMVRNLIHRITTGVLNNGRE